MKKVAKYVMNQLGYDIVNRNAPAQVFFDIDNNFHDLYNYAQQKCQMTETDNLLRQQRHYALNYLLRNADLDSGEVCELGCWRGLSAYQIADHIRSLKKNITFNIFDSFEGLSEYEKIDIPENNQDDLDKRRKQFACSLDIVKENLKDFPFIKYFKGWIPERFNEVKDRKFSFVHIDVDLYQPIYDSFQFFYPRLVENGVMVFDDYGYVQFPGAKKAVDECLAMHNNNFFLPLPSGQAFLIKMQD